MNAHQKLIEIEKLLLEMNFSRKEIMSLSEAAKYMAVSKAQLYKLTSKREIKHYCPSGKLIYFRREDLDQFMLKISRKTVYELSKSIAI